MVYFFVVPVLASVLGLVNHEESLKTTEKPAALWALRLGGFFIGAAAGWFLSPVVNLLLVRFFRVFNWAFDRVTAGYGQVVRGSLRMVVVMLIVYGGLLGLTALGFQAVPAGFIPDQDKGYLVVNAQLPDGASLERTDAVVTRMTALAFEDPGIAHVIGLPGYSVLTGTNITNVGGMFVILKPFEERDRQSEAAAPPPCWNGCNRSISSRSRKPRSASSARRRWTAWATRAASRCRSRTAPATA